MLYLRTAAGGFINAATIAGVAPQRGAGGKINGWAAICCDGAETLLAAFYSVPGRIEEALPHLFQANLPAPVGFPPSRRRFVVPYTNKVVRTAKLSHAPHRERGGDAPVSTDNACSSTDCCYGS